MQAHTSRCQESPRIPRCTVGFGLPLASSRGILFHPAALEAWREARHRPLARKKDCHSEHVKSLMQFVKIHAMVPGIRVISPRLRVGNIETIWEEGVTVREVANRCYKSMWKMPPSFLQRNSHNHRLLENIWCTSLLPEHPVISCPLHAGAMDLWPMQTFFVRHGFPFLRQSKDSQHWRLPGHPDRIKSLMDSAEVPLVSICQMIKEPGEVLYNPPKSQV